MFMKDSSLTRLGERHSFQNLLRIVTMFGYFSWLNTVVKVHLCFRSCQIPRYFYFSDPLSCKEILGNISFTWEQLRGDCFLSIGKRTNVMKFELRTPTFVKNQLRIKA